MALCNGDLSQTFSLQFIKVCFWEGDGKSLSHLSVEEEKGMAVVGDVTLHLRVTELPHVISYLVSCNYTNNIF